MRRCVPWRGPRAVVTSYFRSFMRTPGWPRSLPRLKPRREPIRRFYLPANPAGWYPTKVLATEQQLFVLNAKGIQPRRPNPKGPPGAAPSRTGDYVLTLLKGTLSIIEQHVQKNQRAWTNLVNRSGPLFDAKAGFKLPI